MDFGFSARRDALPEWLTTRPVAHRGLHGPGAPENTLPAFEAARDAGYPIELDLHVLRDGEVVVFHDEQLRRATGVTGSIQDETRDSIGRHRLFGTLETIPTFAQLLACVAGRVPLMIEIKGRHAKRARHVMAQLARYQGEVAVQAFDPFTVAWFREHAPELVRGQLAGPIEGGPQNAFERFATRRLLGAIVSRPHFINYELRGLPDPFIKTVSLAIDLPVLCWTVHNEAEKRKAEALGLNYVFEGIRP